MEIACEFQITKNYCFDYIVYVTEMSISHPGTKIKALEGKHIAEKSNDDVTWLQFLNTKVDYFPKGLPDVLSRLTKLTIQNCGLREISRRDLDGLENLELLDINDCLLTLLPDDLFVDMEKLKNVDLRNNKIEFASSELLKPFINGNLIWIDFRDVPNTDACYSSSIHSRQPKDCESLEELMNIIDEKCKKPSTTQNVQRKSDRGSSCTRRSLWPSGRFSDFTIIVGSTRFQVHKLVLGMQSSVFERVFENKTTEMEIRNFSESAVENLLHFLYTSEFKETSDEFFSIATKLEVHKLIEIYKKNLEEKLMTCSELSL